ncbi:MAG: FAD-dependent oxidoreductase [Actinomycetota bacterium]
MMGLTRARLDDLAAGRPLDVAIVGGGINGVAIARDAAMRGLSVALFEKDDFSAGTSAWSTRLVHGGLRYLERGEFRLVRESLRDRETLWQIAPHLVTPLPFVVPVYRHNHLPGIFFRLGMVLYDVLSFDKSVPNHRRLGRKAVAAELPGLDPEGLSGALQYYDGQVSYAERLVVETLLSAAALGVQAMNYATAEEVALEGGRAVGVAVRDDLDGSAAVVPARVVVNAAGPWVDDLVPAGDSRLIGGTKGTHLVVDPFPGAPSTAIYYEARSDNRAVLVVPWNGRYIIGSTDDRYDDDLDTVAATPDEIDYLLGETNQLIPEANLTVDSVRFTYAGVRPLPYRASGDTGSIPRSHLIIEHDDAAGLLSVVGGKLTPHLSLGSEVVDRAGELLGRRLPASPTREVRLPGAGTGDWRRRVPALRERLPWPVEVSERLIEVYGTRAEELIALAEADPALAEVVGKGRGAVVAAEVALAVREESAMRLTDLLHRRTMVGMEPTLGRDVAEGVARLAAPLLGWDEARTEEELDRNRRYTELRLLGGLRPGRTS